MRETALTIGAPYIRDQAQAGTSRLCSMISHRGVEYEMYFEVRDTYRAYLCDERADAFFAALLPYAMLNGFDLKIEGGLSVQLYYKAKSFFVPALSAFSAPYRAIEINAQPDGRVLNGARGVGTGFSGGVDSFFTIAKNIGQDTPGFNLTHLTFFNVGASGDDGGDAARELFMQRQDFVYRFAEEIGLPAVTVDSNMSEFLGLNFLLTHTFRNFAAVLALQKLFSVYYYSSSHTINEFSVRGTALASGYADLLFAHCFSNENTAFHITGLAESRIEKTAVISNFAPSYNYLNVCLNEVENCGICNKCKRTLMALDLIGSLDRYAACFDLAQYARLKKRMLVYLLANRSEAYNREILNYMRSHDMPLPLWMYAASLLYRIGKAIYGPMRGFGAVRKMREDKLKV